MRRVRSTNTAPERKVRSLLHGLGFRFRLHRSDLPGCPDIVLPKRRAVIFVHGCFWHRHPDCPNASTPASRQEYWLPKFMRTVERDRKNQEELCQRGWQVIVIWECETRNSEGLTMRLEKEIHIGSLVDHPVSSSAAMAAEKIEDYNCQRTPDKYSKL